MAPKVNKEEYAALKSKLIRKGTNINRWAAQHGYPFTTVYDAAKGVRAGIKAIKIKRQLEAFANE
jgi:hypothetical protein